MTVEPETEVFDGMLLTELAIWNRALSRCGDYRLTFQSAKTVTAATAAFPVVCTCAAHGFSDGDLVVHFGFHQMLDINARVFRVENVATNTYQLADEDGTLYTAESTGGFARKLGTGKAAQALFDAWPLVLDKGLRKHPWKSATKSDRLARLASAKAITGATAANPVVITTSGSHGYVSGDRVKITQIGGMVEITDRYFTVGTVPSSTTFQLSGIDGTLFAAYTSGGRVQKALPALVPDSDYAARYDLPSDCVRVVEVASNLSPCGINPPWVVRGREVFTDSDFVPPLRYVRRLRDTTKWDPLLQDYMVALLAYEIVEELAQSTSKKELLRKDLDDAEKDARGVDAQEQSVNELARDAWDLARL